MPEDDDFKTKVLGIKYKEGNHNLAFAFMELTLAEALGLENKRIKKGAQTTNQTMYQGGYL